MFYFNWYFSITFVIIFLLFYIISTILMVYHLLLGLSWCISYSIGLYSYLLGRRYLVNLVLVVLLLFPTILSYLVCIVVVIFTILLGLLEVDINGIIVNNIGQMSKTRSPHQSYQCLMLLPFRRFPGYTQ